MSLNICSYFWNSRKQKTKKRKPTPIHYLPKVGISAVQCVNVRLKDRCVTVKLGYFGPYGGVFLFFLSFFLSLYNDTYGIFGDDQPV
jgi:hypothetical protein